MTPRRAGLPTSCITHGNGPQVGNLLIQQEQAGAEVPALPLDVLVAMTEGSLGYILQQALLNELRKRQVRRYVVTVVTQVVVDEDDPAFAAPSKPIGPFLSREEAERRRDELGWKVKEDAGRGWRRLVPSPAPRKVIQRHMIRDAVRQGHIVVACGGGGIPVKRQADGQYGGRRGGDRQGPHLGRAGDRRRRGAPGDPDRGAAGLRGLRHPGAAGARGGDPARRSSGSRPRATFPRAAWAPRSRRSIRFLKAGGRRALITNPESLPRAIEGRAGTHFVGGV